MNQTLAKDALEELTRDGWFHRREDGWFYAVKPPSKKDLAWFLKCFSVVVAYSVGNGAPVEVTSGGPDGRFGKMYRLRDLS